MMEIFNLPLLKNLSNILLSTSDISIFITITADNEIPTSNKPKDLLNHENIYILRHKFL